MERPLNRARAVRCDKGRELPRTTLWESQLRLDPQRDDVARRPRQLDLCRPLPSVPTQTTSLLSSSTGSGVSSSTSNWKSSAVRFVTRPRALPSGTNATLLRAILKCDRCSSAFFARLLCTSPPDDNDGRDNNEDDAARDDRKDGLRVFVSLNTFTPTGSGHRRTTRRRRRVPTCTRRSPRRGRTRRRG